MAREAASAAAMDFADCFSREDAHFDCANNFLSVARGNPAGGFAIQSVEQAVQVVRAVRLNFCAKTFAEFFGASRRIGESFEKRAEVKAGARGEDGKFAAPANIFQNIQGAATKFSGGKDFLRFDKIDEVMRNSTTVRREALSLCQYRNGGKPAWNRRQEFRRRAAGRVRFPAPIFRKQ